jgi:2-keto-4-pentenoate hydratase/2-oxohepta-3-ene-1,7-dioic acid hydratase in catechol pathway
MMRLVRFQRYRRKALGALLPDGRIVDLEAAAAAWLAREQDDPLWEREVDIRLPSDTAKFLAGGRLSRALADAAIAFAQRVPAIEGIDGEPLFVDPSEVRLSVPLIAPLVLASGAVFREGAQDSRSQRHDEFFMRNPFNIFGPSDEIQLPTWLAEDFDLCARLIVVIGHRLCCCSSQQAKESIFGYCPAIEVCARSLQTISWAGALFHVQYPHARAFDGSLLLGAAIVSKDEIGETKDRMARIVVDDATAFEAPLTWGLDELADWMCHVSKAVTFEPGTLLVPGSAADTVIQPAQSGKLPVELINKVKSQRDMLRSGASVRLAIDGVGGLQTRIRYLTQSDIRRVSASSRAAS